MEVAGSIALLTGANRGQGLAFGKALVELGAAVWRPAVGLKQIGSLRLKLGETLAQAPRSLTKALIHSASYPRSARSIDPDLRRDKSFKARRCHALRPL